MTIRATVNNQGLWGRYVPVEYIQSTGAAYINTNIIRINVVFECDMKFDSTTARSLLGHSATQGHYFGKDATNHPELGGGVNIPTVDATERHTYSYWYDTVGHLEVAGQSIQRGGAQAPTASFQTVISGYAGPYTLYRLRVLDGATILRDFVPVKDTTTGEYGMLDRVEGRFYGNIGTGSFTGGSEIKRIGYLESTGTQYIDTGFLPDNNSGFKTILGLTENVSDDHIFGARDGNGRFTAIQTGTAVYVGFDGTNNPRAKREDLPTAPITFACNYLNGRTMSVYGAGVAADSFENAAFEDYLTAMQIKMFIAGAYSNASGAPVYHKYKQYMATVTQGNEIVRSFIPVKLGTTGYMLDTVEWKLYANAGTGSFTLGPEIHQEQIRLIKAKVNGQMKTINSARMKISGQMREIYHAMV